MRTFCTAHRCYYIARCVLPASVTAEIWKCMVGGGWGRWLRWLSDGYTHAQGQVDQLEYDCGPSCLSETATTTMVLSAVCGQLHLIANMRTRN